MTDADITFAYFAGEPLGTPVLEHLLAANLKPDLVVCNPDRPQGRKQLLTPPPVKTLAAQYAIPTIQPEGFRDQTAADLAPLLNTNFDLFVVVAYNHILPGWLLDTPTHRTLNVHPSLLPLLRGPSPIRSAILRDQPEACGTSVILLDEKMDHGPILDQVAWERSDDWPPRGPDLDAALAKLSGELLVNIIPEWIAGNLTPQTQEHSQATYTSKLNKAHGELALDPFSLPRGADAYAALLKIRGLAGWPGCYFFYNEQRIKITEATVIDDQLHLIRVIPAGKKEVDFTIWQQQNQPV